MTAGRDAGAIVQGFLTGGVSGDLTALVLGFLKAKLAASSSYLVSDP
jgi:hypothetical protein